jgi:hypothetical protein
VVKYFPQVDFERSDTGEETMKTSRFGETPSLKLRRGKPGWIPAHGFAVSGMTVIEVFTSILSYLDT